MIENYIYFISLNIQVCETISLLSMVELKLNFTKLKRLPWSHKPELTHG